MVDLKLEFLNSEEDFFLRVYTNEDNFRRRNLVNFNYKFTETGVEVTKNLSSYLITDEINTALLELEEALKVEIKWDYQYILNEVLSKELWDSEINNLRNDLLTNYHFTDLTSEITKMALNNKPVLTHNHLQPAVINLIIYLREESYKREHLRKLASDRIEKIHNSLPLHLRVYFLDFVEKAKLNNTLIDSLETVDFSKIRLCKSVKTIKPRMSKIWERKYYVDFGSHEKGFDLVIDDINLMS